MGFVADKSAIFVSRASYTDGKFIDLTDFKFRFSSFATDDEMLFSTLLQIYEQVDFLPDQIYLRTGFSKQKNHHSLTTKKNLLSRLVSIFKTNESPQIIIPKKGEKLRALEIAEKNARAFLKRDQIKKMSEKTISKDALANLSRVLNIP